MSDTPIDINELLGSFAAENAKQTQRALVAEAEVKALRKIVENQQQIIASLQPAPDEQPAEGQEEPTSLRAEKTRRGSGPKV